MIPLLMVPGLLCSAEMFAPQATALWRYGPITIASTLQGSSVQEIANAILANAPPRFALSGISMGGYLCFELLRQAPERVERLALLNTSARADAPQQVAQRHALLAQAAAAESFGDWATEALTSLLLPAHRQDFALRAINRRMALTIGMNGFRRQTEAVIGRPDSRGDLSSIRVPTLVLVGADDMLTPPSLSEEIAAAIPQAHLAVVPECGHGSTLEQPEAVTHAMENWLAA